MIFDAKGPGYEIFSASANGRWSFLHIPDYWSHYMANL